MPRASFPLNPATKARHVTRTTAPLGPVQLRSGIAPATSAGATSAPGRPKHSAGRGTERAGGELGADVVDPARRRGAASSTQTPGPAPGSGTPSPGAERTVIGARDQPCRVAGPTACPGGARGAAHRCRQSPCAAGSGSLRQSATPGSVAAPLARPPADPANAREREQCCAEWRTRHARMEPHPPRVPSRGNRRGGDPTTVREYRPAAQPLPRVDRERRRDPDRAAAPDDGVANALVEDTGGKETVHDSASPIHQQPDPPAARYASPMCRPDAPTRRAGNMSCAAGDFAAAGAGRCST